MNNNDTGMNGVNNGFNNNVNGGFNPSMDPMNQQNGMNSSMNGESLQGMSLGSMTQPTSGNDSMNMNSATPMDNLNSQMNMGTPTTPDMNMGMGGMDQTVMQPQSTMNPTMNTSMDSLQQPENAVNVNPTINNNIDSLGTIESAPVSMEQNMNNGLQQPNLMDQNTQMNSTNLTMDVNSMNSMSQGMDMQPMNLSMDMNNNGMNNSMNPQMGMGTPVTPDMNMGMGSMGAPMSPDMSNPNFGNPQMPNNIIEGIPTPPSMGDFNNGGKKQKKGMSKTTIILLIVLLIAAIGAGVYYVLTMTKKPAGNIVMNDLQWDLGKPLSTNISDYATITGFDSSVCSLDVTKVDINKMGAYDYTVTCGTTSKSGKIILQDKTAPVVVTKKVIVAPGSTVQIEDFIASCTDASNCSYELEDETIDLTTITAVEGTQRINIVVTDDYNNQTTVEAILEVTNNAPVKFMYCTPNTNMDNDLNATLEVTYNYGIDAEDQLVQTQKINTYTFDTSADYEKGKEKLLSDSGDAIVAVDDNEFVVTVTMDMEENDLSTEFNVNPFPSTYDDLKDFNVNQGISCKNR